MKNVISLLMIALLLFLVGTSFAANTANIVLKNFKVSGGIYTMEVWVQNTTAVSPSAVTHVEFNIVNYGVMSDLSDFPTVAFEPRYNNGSGWVPRSTFNPGSGVTYSFYQDGFTPVIPSSTLEKVCTVTFTIQNPGATASIKWATNGGYWGGNGFDGGYNGCRGYINSTASGYLDVEPLPIQLSSFKASTLSSNIVTLTWTTASETNNYGFNVQRNGANIAFIHGHGTTLEQHSYSYTDYPGPGKYQYRLQQLDLNGTATLSESILMDVAGKFALNPNYPNPFNPSTQIGFSVTKEGPVSLRIYDVLGREVATLVNENRKPGQYTESFNGSQIASGVYVYVLQSSEGQLTGRMMMLK